MRTARGTAAPFWPYSLLGAGSTWLQILVTLGRVGAGFLLAFLSAALLGLLSGGSRRLETLFNPLVLLLQGIPPLLWAIPLILVFAPGLYPRLRELVLPHLRPFLASSLRLGIVLGIKASVIGEYFGANDGIGFQIQAAFQSMLVRKLFAWGVLLVLLIVLADRGLKRLELALRRASVRLQEAAAGVVRVSDTGIGMSEKEMPDLFKEFYRVKNPKTSGIGLATARRVIAEYKGRIEVKSTAERGTTFTVTLPQHPAQA